ncbi:MAG: TraB/GumN family protein, partial [Thiohalophilus sp.]
MKRFFYSVQIIALGLLMGAAQATGQNSDRQGLLWEITASSGKPSYLYGTIHSEDPRVTNLNGTVQEKFDQADVFCAEMQLDMATQLQMTQGMLYLNGQTLDQKISPELFKKTASLVSKYGIPEQLAPMLKPWAAGLLLSVPV